MVWGSLNVRSEDCGTEPGVELHHAGGLNRFATLNPALTVQSDIEIGDCDGNEWVLPQSNFEEEPLHF
jgi:hypothetical protein